MHVQFTEDSVILYARKEEQLKLLEVSFVEKILQLVNNGDIAHCERQDLQDGELQIVITKHRGLQPRTVGDKKEYQKLYITGGKIV